MAIGSPARGKKASAIRNVTLAAAMLTKVFPIRIVERMRVGAARSCSMRRAALGLNRRIRWIWMGFSEKNTVSAAEKKAERQKSRNRSPSSMAS